MWAHLPNLIRVVVDNERRNRQDFNPDELTNPSKEHDIERPGTRIARREKRLEKWYLLRSQVCS